MPQNGKDHLPRVTAVAICKGEHENPCYLGVMLDGEWVQAEDYNCHMLIQARVMVVYGYCRECIALGLAKSP